MGKGCCGPSGDPVRKVVREAYGGIARGSGSCCGPSRPCCGSAAADKLARGVGYGEGELAALPEGANLGLSCGNPTAIASLREGETVLDLGSGSGFDAFIAARKVGPKGRVIGVDMTPEMIDRARKNISGFRSKSGLDNVEFRLGEIENLPAADCSADVVLSNCVINLSPEKQRVWAEAYRVLKPGGRVAVSDMALLKPLPGDFQRSVEALVGCVSGAVLVEETRRMLETAGFSEIRLVSKPESIDAMSDWSDPVYRSIQALVGPSGRMSDWVTSLEISARKPL